MDTEDEKSSVDIFLIPKLEKNTGTTSVFQIIDWFSIPVFSVFQKMEYSTGIVSVFFRYSGQSRPLYLVQSTVHINSMMLWYYGAQEYAEHAV